MNELLTWGLPIFAALALVAISYAQLQVTSRGGDYLMAKVWFGLGALIIALRFIYWGATTNHSLALRLIVSLIVCGLTGWATVEAFRSINHKRDRLLETNQESNAKAQRLVEEKQWYETPGYDLTSTDTRPIAGIAASARELKEQNTSTHEPEPNIVCLRVSDPFIVLDGHSIFRETNYGEDRAILVEFCNEPDPPRKIKDLNYVEAQIFYYNLKGYLELRVNHGCWLDEDWYSVSLDVNRVRKLLIGLVDKGEFTVYDSNHESPNRYLPPDSLTLVEFRGFDIQVRLVGGTHAEWTKDFWFELKLDSDKLFVFRPAKPKPELAARRGESVILINADSES